MKGFGAVICLALLAAAAPAKAQNIDMFTSDYQAQWTRIAIPPTHPVSDIAQWHIDAAKRQILCDGNGGHEWLRFNRVLGNFTFHVQFRFFPEPGPPKYNSGIFFRNDADGNIWHQAQTTPGGGYLFGVTPVDGKLTPFNLSKQMTENRMKPEGKWNVFDIRCVGATCTLAVNDVTVNTVQVGLDKGYVGLESEGSRVEFKDLKLTELP